MPQRKLWHFAFWRGGVSLPFVVSESCQKWMGRMVLEVITRALAKEEITATNPNPQDFSAEDLELLKAKGSVFVTLKLNHNLRGCIGSILPYEPLYLNVQRMALSAAFNDPRFPPLTKDEWPNCSVEISVLSTPTPCDDWQKIEIGRHGLILRFQNHSGVFLPQVPVEQGWNLQQYLDHLCLKAGVAVGTWRNPECKLEWYEAQVFAVPR